MKGELFQAIEHARVDLIEGADPDIFFSRITEILQSHFDADAVAVAEVRDLLSLRGAAGVEEAIAIGCCRESADNDGPGAIPGSNWKFAIGAPIASPGEKTLGSVFLGRTSNPWSDTERACLEVVTTQLASALLQIRRHEKGNSPGRELAIIQRVDLLSTRSPDEAAFIGEITHLLIEEFDCDFCMMLLREDEDWVVKRLIDRFSFSQEELELVRQAARDLSSTRRLDLPLDGGGPFLMAAPLITDGATSGAIVIGRSVEFSKLDRRLFDTAAKRAELIFARNRTARHLEQRNRELEAVFRIDRIRDEVDDFDEMLNAVLAELCEVISSETGYILLYNPDDEDELELRATTMESIGSEPGFLEAIKKHSRETLGTESMINLNRLEGPVESIIAVPLILNERVIGVFGAINSRHHHGFDESDARMLSAITSQVDTAVFERLERRRMRQVLSRSVDPKVLDALLQRADDSLFAGERVILTVLFADMRGSTEWAEEVEPEEFVTSLNTFLGRMTDVIFKHGGTLDKFVGDEVIALFGSPGPLDDHAYKAARAALEMQQVHQALRAEFEKEGKRLPPIGVGISSGEVIAGEFGPPNRTDFTAMGRVTNLGSRLCAAAEGRQIIISEATNSLLEGRMPSRELARITLKGIREPVPVFELLE